MTTARAAAEFTHARGTYPVSAGAESEESLLAVIPNEVRNLSERFLARRCGGLEMTTERACAEFTPRLPALGATPAKTLSQHCESRGGQACYRGKLEFHAPRRQGVKNTEIANCPAGTGAPDTVRAPFEPLMLYPQTLFESMLVT